MNIGERIEFIRKKKKYSRRELSDISGVSETAIKQYETGKRQPKIEQVTMLADTFDVPINLLLGLSPFEDLEFITNYKKDIIDGFPDHAKKNIAKEQIDDFNYYKLLDLIVGEIHITDERMTILFKDEVVRGLLTETSINKKSGFPDLNEKGKAESMSKAQMGLLMFGSFLEVLDERHPDLTDDEKKAYIIEYHKHDAIELLLSYMELNDDNKRYISKTINLLKEDQRKGGK